jgi:nucleotide-binding universal stress UspA family protein
MTALAPASFDHEHKLSSKGETEEASLHSVLAVIDGSERTGRVVEQIKVLAAGGIIKVVLLNVQPAPADGRLRGYGSFKREEIKARLIDGLGRRVVTAAGRVLSHSGIQHKHRIEIGDTVETILRVANEEACDVILIANSSTGSLQKWVQRATGLLLATTAGQVAQLAQVPVVVVK